MKLIVTEVTEMHGGNYCVAAWRPKTQNMVRPLPNGANWTQALLQAHGVSPGATISVVKGAQHQSSYPHQTEDTIVDAGRISNVQSGPINWFAANAPPVAPSVAAAFGGFAQHNSVWNGALQGVHVPIGTLCSSLGAVAVTKASLAFIVEFQKLKATIYDGASTYKLPVSSAKLKEAFRQGGLGAVNGALPNSNRFHIRLGLARAWANDPNKCYMMVNGVHG